MRILVAISFQLNSCLTATIGLNYSVRLTIPPSTLLLTCNSVARFWRCSLLWCSKTPPNLDTLAHHRVAVKRSRPQLACQRTEQRAALQPVQPLAAVVRNNMAIILKKNNI